MPRYEFSIEASARLSAKSIKEIRAQLNQIGKSAGIKIDAKPVKQTSEALKDATKQSGLFSQNLTDVGKKILEWTVLTKVIFGLINAFKDGVKAVIELDTALVELRKVTNLTDQGLKEVTSEAMKVGDEVARTTEEVVSATASFSRMGFTVKESLDLAEQAAMLVNIGDGINDIDTSTRVLISTMKGFKLESTDATDILDKLNEVSNNYAVNTSDLAEGIRRVSASLNVAGNSLDQTLALLTAGIETLGDPSKVAVA